MEHRIYGRGGGLTRYPLGDVTRQDIEQGKPKEKNRMLKEGDPAPDFTALDHTGKEVRLSDLRGKKVWLWFFSSPGGGN